MSLVITIISEIITKSQDTRKATIPLLINVGKKFEPASFGVNKTSSMVIGIK